MVTSNLNLATKGSRAWSDRRIAKAGKILGSDAVIRQIAFTLYLLGVETRNIAESVNIPTDTLNGLFKRIMHDGLSALTDRRCSNVSQKPPATATQEEHSIHVMSNEDNITLKTGSLALNIKRHDDLQSRIILFTLLENGNTDASTVAKSLGLSAERVRKLRAAFRKEGAQALVCQSRGQTQEYAVTPPVKAELIRHYVESIESDRAISLRELKCAIEHSGQHSPSEQTLKVHIKKLGLDLIVADENVPAIRKKKLRTK